MHVAPARVVNQHDAGVAVSTSHGTRSLLLASSHQCTRAASADGDLLQHSRPPRRQSAQVGSRHAPLNAILRNGGISRPMS